MWGDEMEPIIVGGIKFIIPEGFKHVKWDKVNEGDTVYTIGRSNGKPFAHGPYEVYSKQHRQLKNNSPRFIGGRVFGEGAESLLIKE